jgi:hypothetical protein
MGQATAGRTLWRSATCRTVAFPLSCYPTWANIFYTVQHFNPNPSPKRHISTNFNPRLLLRNYRCFWNDISHMAAVPVPMYILRPHSPASISNLIPVFLCKILPTSVFNVEKNVRQPCTEWRQGISAVLCVVRCIPRAVFFLTNRVCKLRLAPSNLTLLITILTYTVNQLCSCCSRSFFKVLVHASSPCMHVSIINCQLHERKTTEFIRSG